MVALQVSQLQILNLRSTLYLQTPVSCNALLTLWCLVVRLLLSVTVCSEYHFPPISSSPNHCIWPLGNWAGHPLVRQGCRSSTAKQILHDVAVCMPARYQEDTCDRRPDTLSCLETSLVWLSNPQKKIKIWNPQTCHIAISPDESPDTSRSRRPADRERTL